MKIYRQTFKYVYNSNAVDFVKCIAQDSLKDLKNCHKINPKKLILINNPIPISEIIKKSEEEVNDKWLLTTLKKRFQK